jgi:predicted phosphodiesterase
VGQTVKSAHGFKSIRHLEHARVLIPDSATSIFGKPVDNVVFGYTHEAMVETHQGVLFVNPGSPSLVKQNS